MYAEHDLQVLVDNLSLTKLSTLKHFSYFNILVTKIRSLVQQQLANDRDMKKSVSKINYVLSSLVREDLYLKYKDVMLNMILDYQNRSLFW